MSPAEIAEVEPHRTSVSVFMDLLLRSPPFSFIELGVTANKRTRIPSEGIFPKAGNFRQEAF